MQCFCVLLGAICQLAATCMRWDFAIANAYIQEPGLGCCACTACWLWNVHLTEIATTVLLWVCVWCVGGVAESIVVRLLCVMSPAGDEADAIVDSRHMPCVGCIEITDRQWTLRLPSTSCTTQICSNEQTVTLSSQFGNAVQQHHCILTHRITIITEIFSAPVFRRVVTLAFRRRI